MASSTDTSAVLNDSTNSAKSDIIQAANKNVEEYEIPSLARYNRIVDIKAIISEAKKKGYTVSVLLRSFAYNLMPGDEDFINCVNKIFEGEKDPLNTNETSM